MDWRDLDPAEIGRFDAILSKIDSGEGALPALLDDPATRERLDGLLQKLDQTADNLNQFTEELSSGEGLFARLIQDEEYGREVATDLKELIANLNRLSGRLESGDGTLGMLINDPSVYEGVDQVLVGINESKLLRWVIRNRQKAGIRKEAREIEAGQSAPTGEGPEG